jgi:phosphoribosyl-dephospho-CoA transferase
VWLHPYVWPEVFDRYPWLARSDFVRDWATTGYPVISRRPGPEKNMAGQLPVGIPMPPSLGKQRLAFLVPDHCIADLALPLELGRILQRGKKRSEPLSRWHKNLFGLDRSMNSLGLQTRVYGSVMWQHLTDMTYMSDISDIDLLWAMTRDQCSILRPLLACIDQVDVLGSPRVDGEFIVENNAVHWRELLCADGVSEPVV